MNATLTTTEARTSARTAYVVVINGIASVESFTSKAAAIREGEAVITRIKIRRPYGTNVVSVQTVKTGKIVWEWSQIESERADHYASVDTSQPSRYTNADETRHAEYFPRTGELVVWERIPSGGWDDSTRQTRSIRPYAFPGDVWQAIRSVTFPEPVEDGEAMINLSKIAGKGVQCSWCTEGALYVIKDDFWREYACTDHAHEWFPSSLMFRPVMLRAEDISAGDLVIHPELCTAEHVVTRHPSGEYDRVEFDRSHVPAPYASLLYAEGERILRVLSGAAIGVSTEHYGPEL